MRWRKLIFVAFRSILKNKMRSLLTVLGIIIGVGSVITMISLGQGTQTDVEGQIASLGTNLIMISPGSSQTAGVNQGAGSMNSLTMDDAIRLNRDATLAKDVSPIVKVNGQVIAGSRNWNTFVMGVAVNFLDIRDWSLTKGRFFSSRDMRLRRKVAVLGHSVAVKLFPNQNPVGAQIRIERAPFKVIGVLESKGNLSNGVDQDDVILAPATTVLSRMTSGNRVQSIVASSITMEQLEPAQMEIRDLLRQYHGLKMKDDDDFIIRNQTEITDIFSKTVGKLTLFIGSVASVSLLVGGIGIMNIMLVSVTERTREIGIRMAIGARKSDILIQFLIEAVILSLIGGIIGILSGIGIAYIISSSLGMNMQVNPVVVVVSFGFSGFVGVFFGFYPARKAAALRPIEALRFE